jgi:predicted DNA-binding transcriptional regulator YafY
VRLDRLLAIVVKLLNRNRISARELADEFEVTVRTIYRDVEAINLSGIPIISHPGQNGGFGIMENYTLDRQVLSLQDITSILSVLKGFQATFADKKLAAATEKIQNLLPRSRSASGSEAFEKVVIDVLPWGASQKQKQNLLTVQRALSQQRLLKFTYDNARGERSARVVEPMTLIFKTYSWYLFAFCRLKRDFRIFRLSRMTRLVAQTGLFELRERSYRDFMQAEVLPQAKVQALTLKFSPTQRFRVEDSFDEERVRILKDGSALVNVTWPDDTGLYGFLLSFGADVEVLEPNSVRVRLREKAAAIAEKYAAATATRKGRQVKIKA